MKYLLILGLLMSCDDPQNSESREVKPLEMECVQVDSSIKRCENEEVVCYRRYNGGISCKFKEQK